MKFSICLFFLYLLPSLGLGQAEKFVFPDSAFQTVFANTPSGHFTGTANGLLILQGDTNQMVLIDAQGAEAELTLIPDKHEVYDVSTKRYTGKSTSGRTAFRYATYATANRLEIDLRGKTYSLGKFDGAYDMAINGLNYQYQTETGMEYLILQVVQPLELDTYWWLRSAMGTSPEELQRARAETEKILLLPGSVLVFAIKTG